MRYGYLLCGAVLLSTGAGADTTITNTSNFGGEASRDSIYIKDGKMRVESGMDESYMIFDSSARTITAVEPSQRSYTVMTEDDLRSMGDAMKQAMRQMEQQLANLPPEQREQMRRMMEQQMGAMLGNAGKPAAKPEVVRTGQQKTVAGHQCEVVRILLEGAEKGNACMAEYDGLGIPQSDRATIRAMMDFSLALMEQFGDMMPAHMQAMAAEGYPVEYESRVGGTPITGSLESIETGALSGDLFSVPAGFSRQEMPAMPGG